MARVFVQEQAQLLARFRIEARIPQAETIGIFIVTRIVGLRLGNGLNCSQTGRTGAGCRGSQG